MWQLSRGYGTGLVLLLCGIIVALISDSESCNYYHNLAYLLGSLLNVNCIALLCGLGYVRKDGQLLAKRSNGRPRDEVKRQQTTSNGTVDATPDYGSARFSQPNTKNNTEAVDGYVPLTEEEWTRHIAESRFSTCCCGSCNFSCFFISAVITCGILYLVPQEENAGSFGSSSGPVGGMMTQMEWKRTLFLVTFGVFVGAIFISWCHRYLQPMVMEKEGIQDVGTGQHSRRFQIGMVTACGLCGIGILVYAAFMYAARLENELGEIVNGEELFVGSAHVSGYEILNPVADGEDWCTGDSRESIVVNVSVAWGGSWGCPSSPDTYCESVVESKVSCLFAHRYKKLNGDIQEDVEDAYVNQRYHSYSANDDDAYDAYAFDYDKDTEPGSTAAFGSQSEQIFGSCETCEARSMTWIREKLMSLTRTTHKFALSFGLGLCLFAWSVYEIVATSKNKMSTEQPNHNGAGQSMELL
ncbi:MAG: hypothetical protein SGBAC_001144 [Bacillariaceae sp.]